MLKKIIREVDCLSCTDPCCRFGRSLTDFAPLFSEEEYQHLMALGISAHSFRRDRKGFYKIIPEDRGEEHLVCPLLKGRHLCMINDSKPLECKLWPFVIMEGKEAEGLYLAVDANEDCPPLTRYLGTKEFDAEAESLRKHLLSHEGQELLRKNPHAVNRYLSSLKVICRL